MCICCHICVGALRNGGCSRLQHGAWTTRRTSGGKRARNARKSGCHRHLWQVRRDANALSTACAASQSCDPRTHTVSGAGGWAASLSLGTLFVLARHALSTHQALHVLRLRAMLTALPTRAGQLPPVISPARRGHFTDAAVRHRRLARPRGAAPDRDRAAACFRLELHAGSAGCGVLLADHRPVPQRQRGHRARRLV